jgi:hypothetical protein
VKGSFVRALSGGRAYLFFRRFFFQKNSPFFRILGSLKTASGNRLLPRLTSKVSIKSINKQTLFFQLFVRTICGKTITIQAQPSDTVGSVKGKVQDKHGQVVGDQYLTYAGKQLDDSRAIADYGIGQGCTLELSSRLLGGCHYCHKQGHNPGAPSHRSQNCRDPGNSWSTSDLASSVSSARTQDKQNTAARNRTHTPETKSEISDGAAVAFWVLVILLFFQQFALAVVVFTLLLIFGLSSAQAFVQVSHGDTSVVLALATSQTHTSFDIHTLPRHQPRPLILADGPAGE